MENASPSELFWTGTALIGLMAALWAGGVSTIRGMLGRRQGRNGPTTLLFISNVLTALIFVVICGLFSVAGLIAIATPPPIIEQNVEASATIANIFTVVNVAIGGYLFVKIYLNSQIDKAVLKDEATVYTTRLETIAAAAAAAAAAVQAQADIEGARKETQ